MSRTSEQKKDDDLLWGCFVNWIETLEKVEKKES